MNIPSTSLSEFKKATGKNLKDSESVHLTVDGEYIGSFIVPLSDAQKDDLEIIMEMSNTAYNRPNLKPIFGVTDGEEEVN